MYIRKVAQYNKKTGKKYYTHRLVETYRNAENKIRQRLLLNLGAHFEFPQKKWKILADRIEEIVRRQEILLPYDTDIEEAGQQIAKQLTYRKSQEINQPKEKAVEDYCSVDINSLEHQQIRQVGAEHVGLEVAKKIHLDKLLANLKFNRKQINTALASIIGRLVSPASERATHKYLQTRSGLDELLDCDFRKLSLNQLYQISDKLLKHKDEIEAELFKKEKDLFQFEEVITLYDLTNTYFEGRAFRNEKAAFGRSKEKRMDCPLVTLGLLLDSSGFPKKSEVFAGNVSEPETLEQMLQKLKGEEKPTIVLDAGIATEDNLKWLRDKEYTYIVVRRGSKSEMPEDCFVIKHKKDYLIKAKLIKNEETKESELYCYSELKAEKEKSMANKKENRYEEELKKLAAGLHKKGSTKKYSKIIEKLGRLKERYKSVAYTYKLNVITDELKKNAIDIKWEKNPAQNKHPGVYCLRSNRTDLDEQKFWNIYIMLTELEAAFRCLKSELGLRPIYHSTTARVDSHIFISVLAYHLLHTVRYQLKQKNINESWETIRQELFTHCRITSTIKREDEKMIHIRKTCLPNLRQLQIYQALGIITNPGKTTKSIF